MSPSFSSESSQCKQTKPLMARIRMLIAHNTEVDAEIMRDNLAGLAHNCWLCEYPLRGGIMHNFSSWLPSKVPFVSALWVIGSYLNQCIMLQIADCLSKVQQIDRCFTPLFLTVSPQFQVWKRAEGRTANHCVSACQTSLFWRFKMESVNRRVGVISTGFRAVYHWE